MKRGEFLLELRRAIRITILLKLPTKHKIGPADWALNIHLASKFKNRTLQFQKKMETSTY